MSAYTGPERRKRTNMLTNHYWRRVGDKAGGSSLGAETVTNSFATTSSSVLDSFNDSSPAPSSDTSGSDYSGGGGSFDGGGASGDY